MALALRTRHLALQTLRTAGIVLAAIAFIGSVTGAVWLAAHWDLTVTAATLTQARDNPPALRQFLARMPKGGDLHTHLSGAVYAERYIDWAAADGLCWREREQTVGKDHCDAANGDKPVSETARNQSAYDRMVDAFSMRNFVPSPQVPTAHDQFFATFSRFGAVTAKHFTDMVIDQLVYYQDQSAQYAEFMISFSGSAERASFIAAIKEKPTPEDKLAALDAAGLADFVQTKKTGLAQAIADIENRLACDAARTRPGCKVSFRFIAQVSRNTSLDDVFVQTAIAAALARIDPLVVGFNFVQPEDAAIALKDYNAHMHMIAFLAAAPAGAGPVNVALHAGELWLGLVPPGDLTFHITEAVEIAGARRIGHGVSLAFERDADRLLKTMRERGVAVEINLTSNDLVLGVRGKDHPLPAYRAAGVPVVLSTDDAGVERVDLTHEYVRAARDYRLSYKALKKLARASLLHSFLPDADKRRELERFDAAAKDFERSAAGQLSILDGLLLVAGTAVRRPE